MKLNTDKMQAVSAASYLTAPDAVLYRSIMRILYNSKEAYRSQLSIDEILFELHEHEEFESCTADKIKSSMDMLTNWGCVSPMQDPRKVRTIEEYQNRIYRYSLTEEAVIIERMTIELENMFSESNTLPESLLERINSSLKEIKTILESKSNKDLNEWWRNLQEDFKRLSRNYSDYIHSFCSVSGEKMINSVDFLIHKDNFIRYLRSFITQLQKYSVRIENNLKKISSEYKQRLFERLIESEKEIPRTNARLISAEDIREKIQSEWDGLYGWFVSVNGKNSVCSYAMEYTNDVITKMINNAIMLMDLQNSGVSKKHEYKKYMEMFADCADTDEAHCLSAHVFGVMNVRHYKYNADLETDSISENAYDLKPQLFEITPITRNYKPKTKITGVRSKLWDKEICRQQKIEQIQKESELVRHYTINNKLSLSDFSDEIIPKEIRTVILKWITSAFQNANRTGITDFGKKFRLLASDKIITVRFDDGALTMPAYTFEFEGE